MVAQKYFVISKFVVKKENNKADEGGSQEIKVWEAREKGTGSDRFPPSCPSPTDY